MRSVYTQSYRQLITFLATTRIKAELRQSDLSALLGLDQSTVSRYESLELVLDIELLAMWCAALGVEIEDALLVAGYTQPRVLPNDAQPSNVHARIDADTAVPTEARATNSGFNLVLAWRDRKFFIPFPGVLLDTYLAVENAISAVFQSLNGSVVRRANRDAIADALQLAIAQMPSSNPSDIYHHIVYRLYLREYRKSDPKQSWARAGGEALELFIRRHYTPLLAPYGLSIHTAFESGQRNKFLIDMGIADLVPGKSKLDICIYGSAGGVLYPFAGVHSKASLAERVSDDKPCSEQMMKAGRRSYLFTMDAKSFPPPQGRLVNSGELGSPDRPSDKREYIEKHGSFDACFSYNARTVPSPANTPSGKKIYTSLFDNTDAFIAVVTQDWLTWQRENGVS